MPGQLGYKNLLAKRKEKQQRHLNIQLYISNLSKPGTYSIDVSSQEHLNYSVPIPQEALPKSDLPSPVLASDSAPLVSCNGLVTKRRNGLLHPIPIFHLDFLNTS